MGQRNSAWRLALVVAAATAGSFQWLPASEMRGSGRSNETCHAQAVTRAGEFVDGAGDWLTMTTDGQDRHCYVLVPETLVTLDGKPVTASHLKTGDKVLVTTKERYQTVALVVVAMRRTTQA